MSIYRTKTGEEILRAWCEERVAAGPWATTRVVDTVLGSTHVAVMGSGSVPLLWIPGTNFSAATSPSIAATLSAEFTVYVVDLPGQPGLSSSVKLGRDRFNRYGQWLDGFVREE